MMTNRRLIRDAFQLFDKEKKGSVVQEEVSTILRSLNIYPSEKELIKEILPAMYEDEPTAFVALERFEAKTLQLMQEASMEPSSDETMLQAFRFLDKEGKGYIDASTMRDLLTTKGVPFREKEVEAFLEVAKDKETGHIYYEDYVGLLYRQNGMGK